MMDKEKVGSSSKGKMDMENMASIISKPKALLVTTRDKENGEMDNGFRCYMPYDI